jgi:glycosyltransferase involved in cell wall biosynthesis
MRVCLISREFVPFLGWGAGTYASLAAAAWAKAGHEVHVLTADPRAVTEGPKIRPGVVFHAVDYTATPMAYGGWPCPELRHSMGVYRALAALHASHKFEYLEFPDFDGEGFFSIRARRTLGTFKEAVIGVRMHSSTQDIRSWNGDAWLDRDLATVAYMEDECIRGADMLFPCSRAMGEVVRARMGETPSFSRCYPTPNPFDPELLKELRPQPHAPTDGPLRVLFIGRLERRKGVDLLVDAAQSLFDRGLNFTLRFMGGDTRTGPVADSMAAHLLTRIAPRYRDRFTFDVAQHPRSALGPAIARADVCCFPSRWENFPYALLEAMASGAAVVGSDSGGMAEIIQDGVDGLLFRGGDVVSLATVLERALRDAPLRERLRAGAPARVRTLCDPLAVVSRIENRVREAVHTPRPVVTRPEPDVSVVIPVYNLHQYLPEAIASIRSQSVPVREIVIVDDGSTDEATISAIDALGREGCVVVRQANKGLSGARNAGLNAAKGRYVLPLDADDLIDPRFVEGCLEALARDPGLSYVTTLLATFTETPRDLDGVYVPIGQAIDMLPVYNVAGCCTGIFDRAALLAVGGYCPDLPAYEDWDLYCALTEAGRRGVVIPEFWVINRVRRDSMLRRISRRRHEYLRARIMQRHPALMRSPDRTLRLLQSEFVHLPSADDMLDPASIARRMINENIRYRLVDRLNDALKETPLHAALKSLTMKALNKSIEG